MHKYIVNFFDRLFQKEIVAVIISILITSLVSYILFKKKSNKEVSRERLEKVLYPSYIILEPYLYKFDFNNIEFIQCLNKVKNIFTKNRMIVGPKLHYQFFLIFNAIKIEAQKRNYIQFCNMLLSDYNRCCKKIGLPKFEMSCRMALNQCRWWHKILYFCSAIKYVIIICICAGVFLCIWFVILVKLNVIE